MSVPYFSIASAYVSRLKGRSIFAWIVWNKAAIKSSIIENIKLLARTEGIYTETAGGVVISVLQELVKQNKIQKDDLTVAFMTGNGLKTQEIFTDSIIEIKTSPNLKDFENSLSEYKNKTLVST